MRYMKKMKQSDLARGICSVSYLSKIETGNLHPSKEVVDLLLKKLTADQSSHMHDEILEKEIHQFYEYILNKRKTEARQIYEKVCEKTLSDSQKAKFEVFSLFYLLENDVLDDLPKRLQRIFNIEEQLSHDVRYYFYKALGVYYYKALKFHKAILYFQKSVNLITMFTFQNHEYADLYYSYALTASRLCRTSVCLKYSKMALSLFQSLYLHTRCVNCHILLGISYRRLGNFDEAIEQYQTALRLAEIADYKEIFPTIQHNLGFLYGIKGESKKAINQYDQVLESRNWLSPSIVAQTILSLVNELYKVRLLEEAQSWLQEGWSIINEHSHIKGPFLAEYTFFAYLLKGEYLHLEKLMLSEIIPSLEKENKYLELSNYCYYLGDYFFTHSKYKNAARYFAFSREFLSKSMINK